MKRVLQAVLFLALGASVPISNLLPSVCFAQRCEKWAAKAVSVQGTVLSQRAGEKPWQRVNLNDVFCPGDTLAVHEKSRADVLLTNESVLRLNENTSITFEQPKEEGTSLVDLFKGAAHFFSRRPRSLDVQTPYAVAGVRGTEFFIRVEKDKTFLSVFEGSVLASNAAGSLALTSGMSAEAEAGKAPVLRVVVRPRDAVQWALYYPPVLYTPPGEAPTKEDLNDPRFLAHRASVLLAVGRVDEANADIERALRLKPDYGDAYALQSIIAVVQNDKDKALSLAQKAVELDPNSATARIALSYAQQARFDLEGARASLQEAVKVAPNNALAWARLAELWASFGDLDRALSAARKAAELSPNLSRTQTVLGFAYLEQVNTKEAKEAFDKAIALDQADYLPRLGLGLAKIRDGDLKEGGQEIEIAASLDPNNSLVRSYLGKLYYEEKRGNLDEREYAVAKELDPKDPTPWFYDAIAKQTTNRPVEALHDIQKAIELNDNRAVYRSKLLLDSDLAARSAALARIYGDLGFQQLALVEGWKSVNTDPSNYSAHRFLADSYSALPRHEVARVSELLQSQLLQPTNITPIQPRLAESDQYLISSEGPGGLSFSEFNPLFNYNRAALQASGMAGENRTYSGEAIVSGIYKNLSFSAGYTGFETDGFRINDDQRDNLANVFAQYELSPKTSIQAEYRYRNRENGDLALRFDPNNFDDSFRENTRNDSIRLGLRHSFSPGSVLLGNFMYQDQEYKQNNTVFSPVETFFGTLIYEDKLLTEIPQKAYNGEAQYIFRSKSFNLTGGAGYFKVDENRTTTDVEAFLIEPFFMVVEPLLLPEQETHTDHTNLYLYSYIYLPKDVTLSVGASGDFLRTDFKQDGTTGKLDKDQFNPKFGITWNPLPNTTIRGAAFRVFKRTLITGQTLEPTQVAGFNQFYDDLDGTDVWRYGGAIDQKFSQNIYGGLEFSKRDLDIPVYSFLTTEVTQTKWEEQLGRAYLYWTPHEWLALRAEYLYEEFDRKEEYNLGVKKVKTHRVPLGINFFHPSGLMAGLQATYFNQEGEFLPQTGTGLYTGRDEFWLVDAAISYRLPKRYGFITVGAKNLFDRKFQYFDTDPANPSILPGRFIFAKVTLAIP
jgi:tetratricopeptide (TPR) repeat protein